MKHVVCKGAVNEKSTDLSGLRGRQAVCKGAVSQNITAFGVMFGGRIGSAFSALLVHSGGPFVCVDRFSPL